jgi:hypothetical protein
MTTENTNGKVIFAEKAEEGKHYITAKGKIILKFLGIKKVWQKLRPVFINTETENEIELKPETLVREITQGEVKEMTEKKKKTVEAKKSSEQKKERKKSKLFPFEKIRPYLQSGKPVKSNDIAKKMGYKSANIPDSHVYASFRSFTKKGLVKNLGKGTFQLIKKTGK